MNQYERMASSHYEIKYYYHQEEPVHLRTAADRHHYAMFEKGNKFLINGRTYEFRDHNGNYISTFVSQYSDIIDRNLEPEIKDAVLALHEKGYLTYTSCQGHYDSRHRYIGVAFNTKEQKRKFILEMSRLNCDIYWYDEMIDTVERPHKPAPWWADDMTLHIVYDDPSFEKASQLERRDRPYTEEDLTKFWNIQMCRNYDQYESIVFSFGYPIVEDNIWERIKKIFFYNKFKVTSAYNDFLTKAHKLSDYEG